MKTFLFFSLFSHALFASEEMILPVISKGEVKISYLCEAFDIVPEDAEKEVISFYESKMNSLNLEKKGLILRTRKSPKNQDATIKHRPKNDQILLNKTIFNQLEVSENSKLKCETDVTFGEVQPAKINSCSLTTETEAFNQQHQLFLKMMGASDINLDPWLYNRYDIESLRWKIKSSALPKGITIEKWNMKKGGKEKCLLEASTKFDVPEIPAQTLGPRLEKAIIFHLASLKAAFPGMAPDIIQGNKTLRALTFLKDPL